MRKGWTDVPIMIQPVDFAHEEVIKAQKIVASADLPIRDIALILDMLGINHRC